MFNPSSGYKTLIWQVLIMGFLLSGCSSTAELFKEPPKDEPVNTEYSVIFYIHADADYLYHDKEGIPVQGNSLVFDTALKVAEEAKSVEVFVFYQQSEKKFLGLFPRKKSRLYHYTNGRLSTRVKYRHSDKSEDFLTTEAWLHKQYQTHSRNKAQQNHFLYFGHEIPENNGKKYHRTLPEIAVNTTSFSAGIQKFLLTDEHRFDLVVLSTCNNGTPVMAEHLMSFSDVLLASPQNLHLSHIDSRRLNLMESSPKVSSIQVAESMAEQTFRRLETDINTTITLTVYDFELIQDYKNELQNFAREYESMKAIQYISDNIDCSEVEFFDDELFRRGIITWYTPAKFGRKAHTYSHSGWGCKPVPAN